MPRMRPAPPGPEGGAPGARGAAGAPRGQTKSPARGRASGQAVQRASGGGGERLDARGQAALVAGGLVLVDQAAGAEAVEKRLRGLEGLLRAGGVVGVERLEHLLDGGAHLRALAAVAQVAHHGLLGALLGGLDVGHDGILETGLKTEIGSSEQESMAESWICVNNPPVMGRPA